MAGWTDRQMSQDLLTSLPKISSGTALQGFEAEAEHQRAIGTAVNLAMAHQIVHEIHGISGTREIFETLEMCGIPEICETPETILMLVIREAEEVLNSLETHVTNAIVIGKALEAEAEGVQILVAHLRHLIHANVNANIHRTHRPPEARMSHLQETQPPAQVQPLILSERL